jgi:histidine racemase
VNAVRLNFIYIEDNLQEDKMEYRFVKINPSGNTTILILDKIPREKYTEVSTKIMAETSLCAEQVGFLEQPQNPKAVARLHMMGGEFCGNASRSLATWIALGGLDYGKPSNFSESEKEIAIEMSGHQGILTARVKNQNSDYSCFTDIEMPTPLEVRHGRNDQLSDYSIVVFEGILHVILWSKVASEVFVDIVRDFLEEEKLSTDCFGIMFFDGRTSAMVPVVYVGAVASLVWEKSCGSGTVAVACAIAHKEKKSIEQIQINQPGGPLFTSVDWQGHIASARLAGDITITAVGTAYID